MTEVVGSRHMQRKEKYVSIWSWLKESLIEKSWAEQIGGGNEHGSEHLHSFKWSQINKDVEKCVQCAE